MNRHWRGTLCGLLLSVGCSVAAAAVEVNQASADDLESIRGIGPATAQRILQQRQGARFRDWRDFIVRVPGIGEKRAARLSAEGLRVQGQAFDLADPATAGSAPAPIGYAPRTPAPARGVPRSH